MYIYIYIYRERERDRERDRDTIDIVMCITIAIIIIISGSRVVVRLARRLRTALRSEKGKLLLRGVGILGYVLILGELCLSSAHLCSGSLTVWQSTPKSCS